MNKFLHYIFKKEKKVDLSLRLLESKISFERVQRDIVLIKHIEVFNNPIFQNYIQYYSALDIMDKASADEEIVALNSYLEILQVIFPTIKIVSSVKTEDISSVFIPTGILIPLIQNAVLNGYHSDRTSPIRINLSVFKNRLKFEVSNHANHYLSHQQETEDISFLRSRLYHHFGENYQLLINSNSRTHKATLLLSLV